jgi:phosphatidylglycerophosphatase A
VTTIFLFSLFHIINLSNNIILITLLLIFVYSFYAVGEYIKDNVNKDPKEVVIDEFIGQSIPIYLYEISHKTIKDSQESALFYLYIFILFRYFDIKKPFPVSYFDKKFKNSFGVILDDVVAGLYVVLTLIIFMFVKSKFFS